MLTCLTVSRYDGVSYPEEEVLFLVHKKASNKNRLVWRRVFRELGAETEKWERELGGGRGTRL